MRVHANTHPHATVYLNNVEVRYGVEADDAEGWVEVLDMDTGRTRTTWPTRRLTGAVRIELGDETGG